MIPEMHNLTGEKRAKHKLVNGGYNDFPPAWREITAEEFAKSRHFTFTPVLVEFRQMIYGNPAYPSGSPAMSARLEWQADGTGFSVVNDFWEAKVKYYAFGVRPADFVEIFDTSD